MILQKVKCVEGAEYSVKIWDGENLGKEVCIDFESTVAPFHTRNHEPVVLQAFGGTKDIYLVRLQDAKAFLNCHYLSSLIGQNIPFDMGVLSKLVPWKFIFEYYDANRVFDTRTMWNLYNLAAIGDTANQDELSLKAIYRRLFGHEIDKNQDIRTTFGDYLGMQYEDMPKDHLAYAALDVVYTYNVYCKLRSLIKEHDKYNTMLSMHIRVRGELAIDQMYKNGIGIDLSKKDLVKTEYETEVAKYARKMAMWGIVEGRVGVNDMKQKALEILGIADKLPKTKLGISTAKDDLKDFSHIPFISDYLNWQANKSMLKYLVDLEDPVIYPSYNSLLVTGRISASKGHNGIPVQQLPRDGGIRDLFIARSPDKALVDVDYDGIELSALGHIQQMLYGSSRMADILNTGRDLHTATAAAMFKVDAGPCTKKDMGQVTKEMRQAGKAPNFSFGANASPEVFIKSAKKDYNQVYTKLQAIEIKEAWVAEYDMDTWYREPFNHVDGEEWDEEKGRMKNTYAHYTLTGRKKAFCSYTEFLNCHFQGISADGMLEAMYDLFKAGHTLCLSVHDNLIVEADKGDTQALRDVCTIMVKSMRKVITSTKVGVEGRLTPHLGKKADGAIELALSSDDLK